MNKAEYRAKVGLFLNMYTDVVFALERATELKEAGLIVDGHIPAFCVLPNHATIIDAEDTAYLAKDSLHLYVSPYATEERVLEVLTDMVNEIMEANSIGEISVKYLEPIKPDWTTTKLRIELLKVWEDNVKAQKEYLESC